MLEQAQTSTTVIYSTRRGEFAEIIANAGGGANASGAVERANGAEGGDAGGAPEVDVSRVGSLDDLDGIVVVGGDGTFFEVLYMYCRLWCKLFICCFCWHARARGRAVKEHA